MPATSIIIIYSIAAVVSFIVRFLVLANEIPLDPMWHRIRESLLCSVIVAALQPLLSYFGLAAPMSVVIGMVIALLGPQEIKFIVKERAKTLLGIK